MHLDISALSTIQGKKNNESFSSYEEEFFALNSSVRSNRIRKLIIEKKNGDPLIYIP